MTGILVLAHMGWSWISLFEDHWPRLKALDRGLLVTLSSLATVHLGINLFWFGRILKHIARSRHRSTTTQVDDTASDGSAMHFTPAAGARVKGPVLRRR